MKKVYPLLIMVICLIGAKTTCAQMRQLSLDATDNTNEVQEFSFYSPSEGYVAFTKYIGFTTDSGRTFTRKFITFNNVNFNNYPVNLTFGFGIKGVKAFNQDTIIVYGDYGLVPAILYSTNGGTSFTLVYHDRYDVSALKTGITSMVFPQDHTTGYAVEADRILKTTNKGLNWFVVKLDVDRYYDHVAALDNDNIFAFSTRYSSYKLVKTNNGGATWTDMTLPAGQIGYAHFLTTTKGWVYVKNDLLYYTANGGGTWRQMNDAEITPFYSTKFQFVNDSTGYALAGLFTVYKTTDSGKVWQQLPRDNDYSYLNYSHNDLQLLNANQLWAGGGHGFIEINTNAGGNPLPTAFFKVDTNGVSATGEVNLRNYSKPGYQFKWLKNGTLFSTDYHARFTHNDVYQFRDTIQLIVSDGIKSDTLVKYVDYPQTWITGFTPTSGAMGAVITIKGYNLSGTFAVNFGGVPASSFTVISNTQVRATVGYGASGNVEVFTTPQGAGSLAGFTFLGNPKVDLPSTISDSILCKAEPVTVTIQNTEPGVVYQFVPYHGFSVILGSATGNGGTISFVTAPISESGQYRIRVNRSGENGGTLFNTYFNIKVEHTKARFVADQVNVTPGEPVMYAAQKGEAKDYYWTMYDDASTTTATGVKVTGITYATSGQKTLQLISVSENGCRDTVRADAAFVYAASGADASCIINPLDSTGVTGMGMSQILNGYDDNIFVIGGTLGAPKLRSMAGVAKEFGPGSHSFFAKYNSNGVLKWAHYFKPGAGSFTSGQTDAQGNIYLTGIALSTQYLYFNNGDSMQFYASAADTTLMGERTNGFILKLDRNGQYSWHTILYDPVVLHQGSAADASADKIAIKDDHIIVLGGFWSKLAYARNGVIQQLYDLPSGTQEHENHAVLKIGTDGTLLWSAVLRFDAVNWHSLSDLSIDKSGNCYLVGTYENYLGIFNASGVEKVTLNGITAYHRAFTVKYNAAGGIEWSNNFVSNHQYGDARLNKVVTDDDGNTYVACEVNTWGERIPITITHSDGTVDADSAISFALYKFDTRGKRKWGVGSRYPYNGSTTALFLSGNELYAAGQLNNGGEDQASVKFVSTDGNNKVQVINGAECFVVKYDTEGVFKRINTSGYNYLVRSLAATNFYRNSKGQFVLGGNASKYIGGSVNKVFGTTWPHAFINGGDGFFVKLGADFCQSALIADAGPDKISCAGDTVTIGVRASGAYYSWTSSPAGFTSDLPNPIPKPQVNTTYYLKVTNDAGETAYDTMAVTLKPAPVANAGSDATICANKSVLLGSPAVSGNSYEWYLLPTATTFGTTVGTTAQVRVFPSSNSTYRLKVVGPNGCPAYDTVAVSMLYSGSPRVVIKGQSALTVCKGDPLTFTTTITNMGPNPVYQWKVRNQKVGTNSPAYTTDSLKNGDYVSVDVTHNNTCELQPTVTGTAGPYTVVEGLKPVVALTGNNVINEGDAAVINAAIVNAGTGYQLKWQDSTSAHNWQDLPLPAPATTYNYKPAATGDKIRITVTVSGACAAAPVSSAMSFIVNKVTGIDPVPAAQYGLRSYPNPVQKLFTIDGLRLGDRWQKLQVTGIDGRQTFLVMDVKNTTRVEIATEGLRPGVYVAILRNDSGVAVYMKFIKL